MQVERISAQGNQVVLRAVATAEEFREAARHGVRAFLMAADAPVPDDSQLDTILGQLMGSDADLEAAKADFAANYLVPRAVRQEGIVPVCSPDVQPQGGFSAAGGDDFVLHISVFPKPAMELSSYGPVAITVDSPHVTDEEVDARMLDLMRQFGEDASTAGGQGQEGAAPEPSLDALDDAWVAQRFPDPGINTVQHLREAVRKSGEQFKSAEFEQYKLSVAAAEMAKRLVGDVPSDIVKAMAASMIDELKAQAAAQGTSIEAICESRGMTEDAMMQEARDEAKQMLQQGLALDALYRHEGLDIEEADRAAALHAIAPGSEEAAEAQLNASGYAFTIEETAQRLRAGRYILEHAHVTVQVR